MNGNWFAPQHRLPSCGLNGFPYFLSWEGEWTILYFLGGSCIIMENGFIGLGGGELPLHLPWINPSARQLYAMTIIMCMLSLFCSTNFTITINGQQK